MGGIVDTIGGLFGAGGSSDVTPLPFNPEFTQSPLGTADFGPTNNALGLSPELRNIYGGLISQIQAGQAQPTEFGQAPIDLSNFQQQLQRSQSAFGQTAQQLGQQGQALSGLAPGFEQRAAGLAEEAARQREIARDPQSALDFQRQIYGPELERQRLSEESRLLNQGLLGSTTGQLQQEATRTAQNQALIRGAQQQQQQAFQQAQGLLGQSQNLQQLGLSARNQGLGATQAQLGAQQAQAGLLQPLLSGEQFDFGANLDFSNQQLARQQGLLGNALQVAQQPLSLAELSLQRAGGALQAYEGTAGLKQQADANQANFFSSLVSSGATAFGGFNQGGGMTSQDPLSASTYGSGSFLPNTQGFSGTGSFGSGTGNFYQFPTR